MCGIVGALSYSNRSFKVTEPYLVRMQNEIRHRGPDGSGIWCSKGGNIGFGHRRLAIIDLSDKAAQPMCNEDGTIWITYNGEIYNHLELRRELEVKGNHRWQSDHSDTEVIIHAFEQWGIECVHRLRGMFAFAVWDGRNRCLYLVRDRLGIKPLYYSIQNDRIVFASEIKAILKDPDFSASVNEEALFHYLSFLTVPAPNTMFNDVFKLQAGTWLKVQDNGKRQQNTYWDVLDHVRPFDGGVSDAAIASHLLSELRTSVHLRKISDMPVGVFLSGGVDSSTNTALFSENESGPVKTFSVGYDASYASYANELDQARYVSQFVGTEHYETILSADDFLSFLHHMAYLQDEPIADPVCVPLYYVSQLARASGVSVCQVGEGADELFLGYPAWKTIHFLERLNAIPVPALLKHAGLLGLKLIGREARLSYEWLQRGSRKVPIFWGGAEAFTHNQKIRLLSHRLRNRFGTYSSWDALRPIYKTFTDKAVQATHYNWMSYLDLRLRLPELLLMRVDKMTMGVSLEARVPFLDHKFVELAMSIPEQIKIRNGRLKHILKLAVRGVIPDSIINRRKQGFGAPIHEWIVDKLGRTAKYEIKEVCSTTDFFDENEINTVLARGDGFQIWILLNFALWWKTFCK
jgi:asparagine synthase (glutamine-hydrolysing)